MSIHESILQLTQYGIENGLIEDTDKTYIINSYLDLLKLDSFGEVTQMQEEVDLVEVLDGITDEAFHSGLIENNGITQRDLFDTKLMGVLTPRPSVVIRKFRELYKESPRKATDYFYKFSQATNYIRVNRIRKDRKWKFQSPYGQLDITVNLSKPEKDPKEIAAEKNAANSSYPNCQLCVENEGYAGRINHPARQNHRIIPIEIQGKKWGFQYSPYVYYNEHCIVFNGEHVPMKIDKNTFDKLFDFVNLFPHYFLGSNADLPIVGGSILSHDHFQGGNYKFAMAQAPIEESFEINNFEDIEMGIVKWPMSVIRLRGNDKNRLVKLGEHILDKWKKYTDKDAFIFAETGGEPHNTITPIARKVNGLFELDLVLRNNITTEEHPSGVFHPHAEWHNIKKENIGLIEVMGLAVLPARLKEEMEILAEYLVEHKNCRENEKISKHAKWVESFEGNYEFTPENVMSILEKEIGIVFTHVLEDAGVFKCTGEGRIAFKKFIKSL